MARDARDGCCHPPGSRRNGSPCPVGDTWRCSRNLGSWQPTNSRYQRCGWSTKACPWRTQRVEERLWLAPERRTNCCRRGWRLSTFGRIFYPWSGRKALQVAYLLVKAKCCLSPLCGFSSARLSCVRAREASFYFIFFMFMFDRTSCKHWRCAVVRCGEVWTHQKCYSPRLHKHRIATAQQRSISLEASSSPDSPESLSPTLPIFSASSTF